MSLALGAFFVAMPVPALADFAGFCGVTGAPVVGCFVTVCAQVFVASAAGQADCFEKSAGSWWGGGALGAAGACALLAAVLVFCVAVRFAAIWAMVE